MADSYEVLNRIDYPALELARVGQFDKVVVYRVNADPNQVRVVRVPLTSWSATTEDAAIKANEKAHAANPVGPRAL